MKSRSLLLAILGMGLLLIGIAGCWDDEPDTLRASALILMVSHKAGEKSWNWRFYFPNPTVTVSSLSQIKPEDEFYTISVKAPSMEQAYTKAQQHLARDLYLGQLEIVIVSDDLSTEDLTSFLNAYNREGTLPKTAYILVASSPLSKMSIVSPQVPIPAVYWESYFDCKDCQPEILARPIWKVWDDMITPEVSPAMPYASSSHKISQMAVYRRQGPPVIFSRPETLGWAYLMGKVEKESLNIRSPMGKITLGRIRGTVRSRVEAIRTHLRVFVQIHLTSDVAQWESSAPMTTDTLAHIETLAERRILSECVAAIDEADKTHTDPFGYGRRLSFEQDGPPSMAVVHWEHIDAQVTVTMQIRTSGGNI